MVSSNERSHPDRDISGSEELVAKSVRKTLDGLAVGTTIAESDDLRRVSNALEWFIPEVLREIHPEWSDESLDGVYPLIARKVGEREIEIVGQCILISDQTLVALHLNLQVHPSEDRVNWLQCSLGEKGQRGMVRRAYGSGSSGMKQLISLEDGVGSIEWAYRVGYGEKS